MAYASGLRGREAPYFPAAERPLASRAQGSALIPHNGGLIVTLTINPAIDRILSVDRLAFERAVNAAKEAWPISQIVKKFTMSVNLLAM